MSHLIKIYTVSCLVFELICLEVQLGKDIAITTIVDENICLKF